MASSNTAASRIVRIVYEIDGVETAIEDQEGLKRALSETGEALGDVASNTGDAEAGIASLSDVATRSEQTQQRLQQATSQLAGGLSQLSALMGTENDSGRVLGQMGHFAATGVQLGSALGSLVPVIGTAAGATAGGVTGALLGLMDALVPVAPAIREVADESTAAADAAIEMGDAFAGAGDRMRDFVAGLSSAQQLRGLQDVNAQITEITDRITQLRGGQGSAMERLEIPELEQRLARLTFESAQEGPGIADAAGASRRRGGGGGGRRDGFRSDNGAALRGLISDADAGGSDAIEFARGLPGVVWPDEGPSSHERASEGASDLLGFLQEIENTYKAINEEQQRFVDYIETAGELTAGLAGALYGAMTTAIQGQEDFGVAAVKGIKGVLVEFGGQMIAEGVGALFTAIGNTVINPPAAATKAAEGAGKLALGVSLGAAGAAIPVPSAGGGQQAKPPRLGPGGDSGSVGPSVVVNMNAPSVITGTRAQTGRELERTLRSAHQRYGRSI